ncbi:MAG: hypothetical protein HKN76_12740 [Saprospiraceae bacterium]|nr:hypothetical protein [Saprospiraceae bacterium]
MGTHHLLLFFFIVLSGLDCKSDDIDVLAHLEGDQVKSTLQKALQSAGGFKSWQEIIRLEFDKNTTLYGSGGEVESESDQHHRYFYQPARILEITWEDSMGNHQIIQSSDSTSKHLNRKIVHPSKETEYSNMVLSSEFVISLPFKLVNKDVILNYQGIDTLPDRAVVHTIQAKYRPEFKTHYDTSDVWWHYFAIDDFRHAGYKVQHVDHVSYVQNTGYVRHAGIVFPSTRRSYRLNADGSIAYLRANYIYSDFIIEK